MAMQRGDFHQPRCHPCKIIFFQFQSPKRIGTMGVKSGRDQDEVWGEPIQGRKNARFERAAKHRSCRAGRQRDIDDIAHAGLRNRSGARIVWVLVGGRKEQGGIFFGHGLGAIAVMNIKVDNCNTAQSMHRLGMTGADRNGVEQTKAHDMGWFCVMARWSYRAERILGCAGNERIDGCCHRAHSSQCGLCRTSRQNGISI